MPIIFSRNHRNYFAVNLKEISQLEKHLSGLSVQGLHGRYDM
jgi:hypothetical protein